MYYSKNMYKEYKTLAAAKGQLTKLFNELSETLEDINQMIAGGSKYYLGDPIYSRRRVFKNELAAVERELKHIAEQKAKGVV